MSRPEYYIKRFLHFLITGDGLWRTRGKKDNQNDELILLRLPVQGVKSLVTVIRVATTQETRRAFLTSSAVRTGRAPRSSILEQTLTAYRAAGLCGR